MSSCSTKYIYTKKHHFARSLNSLQGYSRSNLPADLLEIVKEDINKNEKIVDPSSVKTSLRRLGKVRYYEDMYFIAEMLGWETPMRDLIASNLISDFEEFDNAYSKIEKDRMNSLPFSFILYKLVERQRDLPQVQKEMILGILFEDLPQIYKEWINPELLSRNDYLDIVTRQVRIAKLQEIWDKTMDEMNSLEG